MQIAMRRVDDIDTVDRMFTPIEDSGFRAYLRDKYERTMEHLEKVTTGTARDFLDRSKRIFEEINNSAALRKTRAAVRAVANIRKSDTIYKAEELGEFQAAAPRMQRYLMADPVIRMKYLKQQIDGYSHSYSDAHAGACGVDHYDYRRVTDGVYMPEVDESGETNYVRHEYHEALTVGDRNLDVEEQLDMINNWYLQRCLQMAGVDTTSARGSIIT